MSTAHAISAPESISTGIPNNKLGMWLFLVSEIMFFTGLLAAYVVLRASHPAWPGSEGHLSVPLGTLNTFVLLCSSLTVVMAHASVQRDDQAGLRKYLLLTVLLGTAFLCIKGYEYSQKFHHHIGPSTNIFWSCYFMLTGIHGLHVLIGVGWNGWVLAKTRGGRFWSSESHLVELSGLYWHFVDIVWIFLFPLVYLL